MKRLQTQFVRDISKYTENFCFGMSLRQTICAFLGAAIVAAATFAWGLPVYAATLMGLPVLLIGFWKPDGLSVEKYVFHWLESVMRRPRIRVYARDDILYDFLWKGQIGGRQVFDPQENKPEEDSMENTENEYMRRLQGVDTAAGGDEPAAMQADPADAEDIRAQTEPREVFPQYMQDSGPDPAGSSGPAPAEGSEPSLQTSLKKPGRRGPKKRQTVSTVKKPVCLCDLPEIVSDGKWKE